MDHPVQTVGEPVAKTVYMQFTSCCWMSEKDSLDADHVVEGVDYNLLTGVVIATASSGLLLLIIVIIGESCER